jgi:hypothetical protein
MPVPALSGSSFIADVGQLGVLPADGADSCVLSFGAVQGNELGGYVYNDNGSTSSGTNSSS